MKGRQLVQMIAFVVREELKKQLQPMVERVLTEQYLKRVIREQAPAHPRTFATLREESEDDYEEHIPEQEPGDEGGIYHEDQPNTKLRQPTNEHVRKLLSPDNPFAALYEGVSPLPPANASPMGEVPLAAVQNKLGVDFERMRELAGQRKKPVQEAADAPRRHRPEWDQVVDTRPEHERGAPPSPRRPMPQVAVAPPSLRPTSADSAAFPERPISFED